MGILGSLEVMDGTGHVTLTWNPDDPDAVKKAEAEFERLRGCGFAFFTEETEQPELGASGSLEARLVQTKALARRGRTVARPPMQGG